MSANLLAADAAYWCGAGASSWADQHARSDHAFAALRLALLQHAAPAAGERVLDIGCGGGTTVLEIAARVGQAGHVVGADIAPASTACVTRRISGLPQATALCADVGAHPFAPASFDLLVSQLGVMFFADPAAAMTNLRRALAPGGRLAFGVFRAAAENTWPRIALAAVGGLVDVPPAAPGSGMFSWADPAVVRDLLDRAGFHDIGFAAVDAPIDLGATPAEAVEFAMLFSPLNRVLPGLDAARIAGVRGVLGQAFAAQGTQLRGAFQIVSARG
jgi:SAM-dependent methyltransferase